MKKEMSSKTKMKSEAFIKYGQEIASSPDPLATAIEIGGRSGVGLALSRFSASQCAGIVGLMISSINPQVITKALF